MSLSHGITIIILYLFSPQNYSSKYFLRIFQRGMRSHQEIEHISMAHNLMETKKWEHTTTFDDGEQSRHHMNSGTILASSHQL